MDQGEKADFPVFGVAVGDAPVLEKPTLRVAVLLILAVWCSCRFYYFAFNVIGRCVDADYRFSAFLSFARYLISRRRRGPCGIWTRRAKAQRLHTPGCGGRPRSAELFGADQQDNYEEYQDSEGDHHDSKKNLLFPWALARYYDLILDRNEI